MNNYVHACVCACVCMHMCMCSCACMHAHVHVFVCCNAAIHSHVNRGECWMSFSVISSLPYLLSQNFSLNLEIAILADQEVSGFLSPQLCPLPCWDYRDNNVSGFCLGTNDPNLSPKFKYQKKHFTCTVISLTLDVNCRPSHVHICIHTHTYEHTYIYTVHTYVCENETQLIRFERLFYEHYTHMHAHTNIQRKRERKKISQICQASCSVLSKFWFILVTCYWCCPFLN